jgi:hydrogenase/urease accessory protein HupE
MSLCRRTGASRCVRLLAVLAWILAAVPAPAHVVGLSSITLRIEDGKLGVHMTYASREMLLLAAVDANDDGQLAPNEFEFAQKQLEAIAADMLEVQFDGTAARPTAVESRLFLESNDIYFHMTYPVGLSDRLRLRSVVLPKLSRGHRQYVELQDSAGNVRADKMLRVDNDVFEVDLRNALMPPSEAPAAATTPQTKHSFGSFLLLGVEHIWLGYDHVLFLLALMIVGGSFRSIVLIITSFTVAHTITLALATLDLVRVPGAIVEPLIAATIIYVGIENIVHRNLRWRWVLTFFFGLVHGLGFASVLRDLGIGAGSSTGVAVPLIAFNVGVELGQVVIAAVVLPVVWRLQKHPAFVPRYVTACSALVALAGGYWLVERTLLN